MRRRTASAATIVIAGVTLLLAGCSASSPGADVAATGSPVTGTVTVFAAASLKETFTKIGSQFEAAHPGVRVVLSFGPSSGLAAQLTQGAPADVFASASTTNMDQVVAAGDAAAPLTFARNVMEIAVPAANPAGITGVADLGSPGVKVALCQPAVPCGAVGAKVLANARITVTPVTQEVDVKAVLTKVGLGEVDAGLVYVTDVKTAGPRVTGVTIPADINAATSYPIATLTNAPNPAGAGAFTAYVLSADGAAVMGAGGFAKP